MTAFWTALAVLIIVLIALVAVRSLKLVAEHERGVVFRLGRVQDGAKGPGLFFFMPFVDEMVKVDLRPVTEDISIQAEPTLDGVRVEAEASMRYRVFDPIQTVLEVEDHTTATPYMGQTCLREEIRNKDFDELRANPGSLDDVLRQTISETTRQWAVEVEEVAVENVRKAT